MDILLDPSGDLRITRKGDIVLGDSAAQKIRVRLLWFAGEWRWDVDEGMPYFENLLVKNPNIDYFESKVREKIFEVKEVTEVKNVAVTFDNKSREAVIRYIALTDMETIKEEVRIKCQIME